MVLGGNVLILSDALHTLSTCQEMTERQLHALNQHDTADLSQATFEIQNILSQLERIGAIAWDSAARQSIHQQLVRWHPRLQYLVESLADHVAWYASLGLPESTVLQSW